MSRGEIVQSQQFSVYGTQPAKTKLQDILFDTPTGASHTVKKSRMSWANLGGLFGSAPTRSVQMGQIVFDPKALATSNVIVVDPSEHDGIENTLALIPQLPTAGTPKKFFLVILADESVNDKVVHIEQIFNKQPYSVDENDVYDFRDEDRKTAFRNLVFPPKPVVAPPPVAPVEESLDAYRKALGDFIDNQLARPALQGTPKHTRLQQLKTSVTEANNLAGLKALAAQVAVEVGADRNPVTRTLRSWHLWTRPTRGYVEFNKVFDAQHNLKPQAPTARIKRSVTADATSGLEPRASDAAAGASTASTIRRPSA